MAARIGLSTNLTLACRQNCLLDHICRRISTSGASFAGSWTVRSKSKREHVLYESPKFVNPTIGSAKSQKKEITIPQKINRSPTAVLEALASTVRNDLNQPRYMTIDDPYLYSTTDRAKKAHMAAYESGCKAAQHMLCLYPDYFTQIWEDPMANAWKDGSGYTHVEPSEEALLERINMRKVTDAIDVYRTLVSKGESLSQQAQEKLLELLVVFNCKDPQDESDVETFVNAPDYQTFSPFPPNTWMTGNAAEEVFNNLPEKTASAHCQMIRGMASNFHKEGAINLYSAMKAARMPVDLKTYNALLRLSSLDCESIDDVKIFIEGIMKDMNANNVMPNEDTFASAIINCRRLSRWTGSKKFVLALLSEMKACGLEPGLATYTEILHIFYYFKDKSPKTQEMFEQILDELKDKEFDCKTENDVVFFRAAMGMIAAHFPDPKLALRLHGMLQHGKNRNLLSNRQSQYGYYTDLLSILVPVEHTDTVMELYTDLVPYVYFPPSKIYVSLLESIEMHGTYHYMPQLYADLQWTSMFKDYSFLAAFTQTLAKEKHESKLQSDICVIASSIMENWAAKQNMNDALPVNGVIIGDLIQVHLNNNDVKTSWSLFEVYRRNRKMRGADPSESSLQQLAEKLIFAQDFNSTKEVLNVMTILDYDISNLVDTSLQTMTLSDVERNHLQSLLAGSLSSSSSSSDSSDSD